MALSVSPIVVGDGTFVVEGAGDLGQFRAVGIIVVHGYGRGGVVFADLAAPVVVAEAGGAVLVHERGEVVGALLGVGRGGGDAVENDFYVVELVIAAPVY